MRWQQIAEQLLDSICIIPFNKQTADVYAQLRNDIEKQGKSLSPMDMLIAASAMANKSILITNDQAFFNIPLLQVEDWTI